MVIVTAPGEAHSFYHLTDVYRPFPDCIFQQSAPVYISSFRLQEGKEINRPVQINVQILYTFVQIKYIRPIFTKQISSFLSLLTA